MRLRADTLERLGPLRAGALPWALEQSGRIRCGFAERASNVVPGRRLNYVCDHGRFAFGRADSSRDTWDPRCARLQRAGMDDVAIRVAWR